MLTKSDLINFETNVSTSAQSITDNLLQNITFTEGIGKKRLSERIKFLRILLQNFIEKGNSLQVPFNKEYYDKTVGRTKVTSSTYVKSVCNTLKNADYVKIEQGFHHSSNNRSFTVITATEKLMNLINSSSLQDISKVDQKDY